MYIHLSLFYTICIRHGYLPTLIDLFMDVNINLLLKINVGILLNHYRAIALCNVENKI